MKVDSPQPDTSEHLDAEALIKEARQRQRRRWWSLAIALLLVGVGGGIAASIGSLARKPPARTGSRAPAGGGPTVKKPSNPTKLISFVGKYSVESISFPNASDGYALIGGYTGGNGPSLVWLDRTTDGGRSWQAGRIPDDPAWLAFNSGSDGWAYRPMLLATTDGGRTWHHVPTDGYVSALATFGRYTWMIQSTQTGTTESTCNSEVLRSTSLGATPATIASQPQLGDSCDDWQLLVTGPTTAYLTDGVSLAKPAPYFVTSDVGISWTKRSTPCTGRAPVSTTLAGIGQSEWLRCSFGPSLDTVGDQASTSYKSNDGGFSWHLAAGVGLTNRGSSLVVATPEVAWSWTAWLGLGPGIAEHTTDGGLKWSTVSPSSPYQSAISVRPPLRHVQFVLPESLATSGNLAALAIEAYQPEQNFDLDHLLAGITDNAGRTWRWAYLPNIAPVPKQR